MSEPDWDLDKLDIDSAVEKVESKIEQDINKPAIEPNDGCDGGACTI